MVAKCLATSVLFNESEHVAFVTRSISLKSAEAQSKEALAAVEKERLKFERFNVFDWHNPVESWTAAAADPSSEFVNTALLLGAKHAENETTSEARKYSARLVGLGDQVKNGLGFRPQDITMYMTTISFFAVRLLLFYACMLPDGIALRADLDAAYLNAPLGKNNVYVRLPAAFRPQSWSRFRDPVCLLFKSLYGLYISGFNFDTWFEGVLIEDGWSKIQGFAVLFHKDTCFLGRYVDDVLMSGSGPKVWRYMNILKRKVSFSICEEIAEFLSIDISFIRFGEITMCIMSQINYVKLVLFRFTSEKCVGKLGTSRVPMSPLMQTKPEDDAPGVFASSCRSHVASLLWLARATRLEMLYAVGWMSRYVDKWTVQQDRVLFKCMCYLNFTVEHKFVMVGSHTEMTTVTGRTLADADHAKCPVTRRSTGGACNQIIGPAITCATLDAFSGRQPSSAPSTGHAEFVALDKAVRKCTLPQATPLDFVFQRPLKYELFVDASVVLTNVMKGDCASELLYLHKFPGVNIAFVSDLISQRPDQFSIGKVDTKCNTADVFTKALDVTDFEKHRKSLGIVSNVELAAIQKCLRKSG
jgi:hypothetical protein